MLYTKFLRHERDLSIRATATLARMTAGEVQLIESGRLKPTDQQLAKLASALGVSSPDRLLRNVTPADVERALEEVAA